MALIVFRCLQGAGAALLLAGTLALLSALAGSRARGLAVWTAAGTFGAAAGPAGALTSPAVHGSEFAAVVEDGALSATQFHPEKSADAGAAVLANWLEELR